MHANSPLFLEIKTTNFPAELFCLEILFKCHSFLNANKLVVFKRNKYLTVCQSKTKQLLYIWSHN